MAGETNVDVAGKNIKTYPYSNCISPWLKFMAHPTQGIIKGSPVVNTTWEVVHDQETRIYDHFDSMWMQHYYLHGNLTIEDSDQWLSRSKKVINTP